ncbi:MAG TPA: sulfurtransferase-like selenium metabolism protein YedF [Candidatus Melainabacteria bacterium]|nr:sulfurtransferase-like selenium metabolism protein YedF [Candidatus Melainabacteria bacterium]HIN64158.1 sulfurtransferase-like selenium metabolism protein YedF [Candidatus Obscuribacterales bacterium]
MSTDKKQDSANSLDLRGLMCPEPVLRTKKLLDQKPEGAVEVLVDSDINVMNLTRLANSLGLSLHSKEKDGGYMVVISKKNESEAGRIPHNHDVSQTASASGQKASSQKSANTSVVFIAKDTFGEGDRDFSVNLLNVFLQTILQAGHKPQAILLANTGVRLMDPDSSVRKVLDEFKEAGIEVLACGLCVEFYGLKEKIKAEQITNMYAICEYLFSADKVISP